jgi:hypothetical protein
MSQPLPGGHRRQAWQCGPDLLGIRGGAEIGAVALWGRAPSVYRNLKPTHAKAALTINGGGTADAAATVAVPICSP